MPDESSPRRGRPRRHADDAARKQAYRDRHILTKVTVDVPGILTDHVRAYAERLRHVSTSFEWPRNSLSVLLWTKMRRTDGMQVRLRNGTLRGRVVARRRDASGKIQLLEWRVFSRHQRLEAAGVDGVKSVPYEIVYASGFCADHVTARTLCEASMLLCFSEHVRFDYDELRTDIAPLGGQH